MHSRGSVILLGIYRSVEAVEKLWEGRNLTPRIDFH